MAEKPDINARDLSAILILNLRSFGLGFNIFLFLQTKLSEFPTPLYLFPLRLPRLFTVPELTEAEGTALENKQESRSGDLKMSAPEKQLAPGYESSPSHHSESTTTEVPPSGAEKEVKDVEAGESPAPPAPTGPPPFKPPPGMAPADFPDGGLTAWAVCAGAWCCLFASFGWITCIGVFQTYYQQNQLKNYSPSEVAWIPSVEIFVMQFAAPFCGKVFDGYGPRPLLLFGTVVHVFGLMMASLGKTYYQLFLAQALCSAIGAACLFYGGMNAVMTWFFKRRALATGIAASGSSLGGVIMP